MQEAAEVMEFEKAGRFRDRLASLSAIASSQDINPQGVEEADVFAIDEQAGQFCIQIFFFRTFQNWGNRAYFPKADKALTPAEVLDAFVAQFYADRPAPRLVLLSHDIADDLLLAEALSLRSGFRIEVCRPQRGEKKVLVDHALKNAREALSRRLAETASQQKLLQSLQQAFGLPRTPRRIDVFDNSHIMGSSAVGAMIVAGVNGLMKTHYRTFNIKSQEITPGDDMGMMREVLTRRFARLVKEAGRDPAVEGGDGRDADILPAWPDLVLVDGGRGSSTPPALCSKAWAWRTCRWSASPRASTATPDARPSSSQAVSPSGCRRAIRRSTSCSACATKRIALPSAPIGRNASANS